MLATFPPGQISRSSNLLNITAIEWSTLTTETILFQARVVVAVEMHTLRIYCSDAENQPSRYFLLFLLTISIVL